LLSNIDETSLLDPYEGFRSNTWFRQEGTMQRTLSAIGLLILTALFGLFARAVAHSFDLSDSPLNAQLIKAVKEGNLADVEALLDKGASVDAKEGQGWTALMWASFSNHVGVTQVLLDAGAEVDAHDANGKTALHWAAERGHEGIIRALIKAGADVDARTKHHVTPLICAAQNGRKAAIIVLLDADADMNVKDDFGWTALRKAIVNDHAEVAELLRSKGAKEFVS
jgi:ankyrin repeat protein